MDIIALIGAFGGGALAAAIGGVTSFVFTGIFVLVGVGGGVAGAAGAPMIGAMAFGSLFGPHVAFGGAVAGAAYSKSKGLIDAGADIVTPLFKTGDASVLLVAGVFGVIGFLLNYLFATIIGAGMIGNAGWTDTVALTVFTSDTIVRFVFTKSGMTGKYTGSEPRKYFPEGKRLSFLLVEGLLIGIAIGSVAGVFKGLGTPEGDYLLSQTGVLGFGIGAVALLYLGMGQPIEGFHHVILPAGGAAAAVLMGTGDPIVAIIIAGIMGAFNAVLGEVVGMTINSHVDSHIDPPAVVIMLTTLINVWVLTPMFA